jgi:large subunit ribosomal protein L13
MTKAYNSTYNLKASEIKHDWHVIDAQGQVLGRIATQIAMLLRGKHKPTYTPHLAMGDFVIVLNADKVELTGKKANKKVYYRHTGYPGGLKTTPWKMMLAKHPDRIIRIAVKGMLPKTRLGRQLIRRLHVYAGDKHPHEAQQPKRYEIKK